LLDSLLQEIKMASWGYKEDNGPKCWGKWFPVADQGTRQSPIDICVEAAEEDTTCSPLLPKFEAIEDVSLENTGASWKLNCLPDKSSLTGGPLAAEYQLVQMHAHWGKEHGRGSEHTINGKMYDGELHLVHFNTSYGSFNEAVDKPDGLAVLGIFLKEGDTAHEEFGKITNLLSKVQKKGDQTVLTGQIDPTKLLPACEHYFTYPGSLTTPPLLESVTWLVYDNPITISKEQMASMRSLMIGLEDACDCVVDNYRPVCKQGNRVVKKAKA